MEDPTGFSPVTVTILSISPSLSGFPFVSIPLLSKSDWVTVYVPWYVQVSVVSTWLSPSISPPIYVRLVNKGSLTVRLDMATVPLFSISIV